ncbi:2-succinyl-5-enolpyruvyl-6-hydroxy-3-cyclohexene-1-carboxylic-acid synthase [Flavicella sediminum]|uniref:2-succinyl-5-enolpyruvyl-6-hydroxy-3- cyclohexene-1-carboxylic-acid synthase n=1 Tax=Flavicella sediminum TaxID=2585141 RepID=UPI0011245A4C|nr:2-succinyl-5-enolpyruvyl-6-hydroxy-3-cyclohexene-1-carboxylic-acid synthase [Flavicella sediminum]
MKYPKNELAQLVIASCIANGVKDVVISPGSRNAPLTIGFTQHPDIQTFSIVDERCAAFVALGMAQQKKKLVALVCTSGSALLNYYPAVAEAFYSDLPLLVISADRPAHLIDIGDGQTIRQKNVFENHSLCNANLTTGDFEENKQKLEDAITICTKQKGPVHINVPFDEPLYETVPEILTVAKKEKREKPLSFLDEKPLDVEELQGYADIWNAAKKKIVLVGSHFPDDLLQTQMNHLMKDPSVLLFTETISNLSNSKVINNIDQLLFPLSDKELEDLQPDILITLGGLVVSKKIKQFLRKYQPAAHWHISAKTSLNSFHCLTRHFEISAQLFFSQFFFLTKPKTSTYQEKWLEVKKQRKLAHAEYVKNAPYSDFKVFDAILESLPKKNMLQLSNSSVIRYAQLFDVAPSLEVFCNRGTSGIDGSTSTAIGAAMSRNKQTVFVTGDVSFFYDSNALWNQYIPKNFRIILLNNSGGGIFKFIPGPQKSGSLDYFETPHELNASHLCAMYGIGYDLAVTEEELTVSLQNFYADTNSAKLLEIKTPSQINDVVLKEYFKSLS